MKNILILASLLFLAMSSCTKNNCDNSAMAACNDTPPTDELCQAAFSRWFFNQSQNKCELIGYSGCSQKGFETKQECEDCKCN